MSVHVDEVETRVVPARGGQDESAGTTGRPRLGAEAEAWVEQQRRSRRDGRRTSAHDFDD